MLENFSMRPLMPSSTGLFVSVKYNLSAFVKHQGASKKRKYPKLSIPITIVKNLAEAIITPPSTGAIRDHKWRP